jgi:hypothetical protein
VSAGLRRFAARTSRAREAPRDRCELCGGDLSPQRHSHLVDVERRSLSCACTACGLLFARPGGRYRTVPDRVLHDHAAPLTAADWAGLRIPVGLAFFMVNSALGRVVASYPGPAGATECELDLGEWHRLAAAHPLLREPEPDVEAILVVAGGGPALPEADGIEVFLVPVDACYSLAGTLRLNWRGFDGGAEVRRILAEFLDGIRARSSPLPQVRDAGSETSGRSG